MESTWLRASFSFAIVALVGCGSAESTGITSAEIACPPSDKPTYDGFTKPLIATKCLGCHAGREKPDLATKESLLSAREDVLQAAVFTREMPQGGSMTDDERKKLGRWFSCGGP
jgi:uncharacterized membrane protein